MNHKNIKIVFLSFIISIQAFCQYKQLNYAEVKAEGERILLEMGYIELEPKFPKPISLATLACSYEYTTVTPIDKTLPYVLDTDSLLNNNEFIARYQTILHANSSTSIFRDYYLFMKDSILYYNTLKLSQDSLFMLDRLYRDEVDHQFIPVVVKNYPENILSVLDEVAPNSYNYEEPKSDLKWELLEDTLTICGFLCYKAKTNYGGREWTAWYTSEIPISDGPWKLYGLPGLILKATDKGGIHTFEATSLQKSNFPIYLKPHPASFSIKRKTFLTLRKKLESAEKPYSSLSSVRITSYIGKNYGYIDHRRVIRRRISIYEPLEIE